MGDLKDVSVAGWRLAVAGLLQCRFPGTHAGPVTASTRSRAQRGPGPAGCTPGLRHRPPGRAVSAKADGPPRGTDCCADPAPSILRYTLTSCHSSCNTGNIRLYYVVHHQSVHGTHHDEP